MMKTLAVEEENIRVLNYAPGPLPTDMVIETACNKTKDPDVKKQFQGE